MRLYLLAALCGLPALVTPFSQALAERTDVEVRVMARGAKFMGGYSAPVRVTLTDAETGEVLARGLTSGTTGDTQTIMSTAHVHGAALANEATAAFRTSLDLDRPRQVTLSVTGPLSQPQATTTATSTQWLLPGHHLTAGDGWRMELPGLIVDLASPLAYQWVQAGQTVPLRAGVTLLCGCPMSEDGPWRAADTEVDAYLRIDGGPPSRHRLAFDPIQGLFVGELPTQAAGLYELEVRAWMGPSNNAGVARTAFFVR